MTTPTAIDVAHLERQVRKRWGARDVVTQAVAARPAVEVDERRISAVDRGHDGLAARIVADVIARHRAMTSTAAPPAVVWSCHGIAVEVQAEHRLGLAGPSDIERFGIAEFVDECRVVVARHIQAWTDVEARTACWTDPQTTLRTSDAAAIDAVWRALRRQWDAGALRPRTTVRPHCPRCGTVLDGDDVVRGDPVHALAACIRFPVTGHGDLQVSGASLLVSTSRPWTLLAHTAIAIGPDVRYVLARAIGDDYPAVVAADRVTAVLGPDATVLRDVGADELRSVSYRPPFDVALAQDGRRAQVVVESDALEPGEGTGLVHVAPAFAARDLDLAITHGLAVVDPLDREGRFDDRVATCAGMLTLEADAALIDDLRERGLLFRTDSRHRSASSCRHCGSDVILRAARAWVLAQDDAEREWVLSRQRCWGTPLPVWRCEQCDDMTVVGSLDELAVLTGRDLDHEDPHRPAVDELIWSCQACRGGVMRRVRDVLDARYDAAAAAGALPGAGASHTVRASEHGCAPPLAAIAGAGADALRWTATMTGATPPDGPTADEGTAAAASKLLRTLGDACALFVTHATASGWTQAAGAAAAAGGSRPVLDRWILAELADTVHHVDTLLRAADAAGAGARILTFTDDLSAWYLRHRRRRLTTGEPGDAALEEDRSAAFATLHECLVTVAALLAPFTPFLADQMFEDLVRAGEPRAPDSVHLLRFPTADPLARDDGLRTAMATARRLIGLGRRVRSDAGIPTGQILPAAAVMLPGELQAARAWIADLVAAELEVTRVDVLETGTDGVAVRVTPPDGATVTAHAAHIPDGWAVAGDGACGVAVDVSGEALRSQRHARTVVRAVNELRRRHAVDRGQHILLRIDAHDEIAAAVQAHMGMIAESTGATRIELGPTEHGIDVAVDDMSARIAIRTVVMR